MGYQVVFVGDDDLPDGYDWALVRLLRGDVFLAVKRDRVTPCVLEQAWEAYRGLVRCTPGLLATAV
jgi:hypothetical protein